MHNEFDFGECNNDLLRIHVTYVAMKSTIIIVRTLCRKFEQIWTKHSNTLFYRITNSGLCLCWWCTVYKLFIHFLHPTLCHFQWSILWQLSAIFIVLFPLLCFIVKNWTLSWFQDTVIALQALSEYAIKTQRNNIDINCHVSCQESDFENEFLLKPNNAIVRQHANIYVSMPEGYFQNELWWSYPRGSNPGRGDGGIYTHNIWPTCYKKQNLHWSDESLSVSIIQLILYVQIPETVQEFQVFFDSEGTGMGQLKVSIYCWTWTWTISKTLTNQNHFSAWFVNLDF